MLLPWSPTMTRQHRDTQGACACTFLVLPGLECRLVGSGKAHRSSNLALHVCSFFPCMKPFPCLTISSHLLQPLHCTWSFWHFPAIYKHICICSQTSCLKALHRTAPDSIPLLVSSDFPMACSGKSVYCSWQHVRLPQLSASW